MTDKIILLRNPLLTQNTATHGNSYSSVNGLNFRLLCRYYSQSVFMLLPICVYVFSRGPLLSDFPTEVGKFATCHTFNLCGGSLELSISSTARDVFVSESNKGRWRNVRCV